MQKLDNVQVLLIAFFVVGFLFAFFIGKDIKNNEVFELQKENKELQALKDRTRDALLRSKINENYRIFFNSLGWELPVSVADTKPDTNKPPGSN